MASIKLKGDTSGEVIISAPSVAGNTTLELQATSGTLATTAQASIGSKNLIINGDMRIAQRGTSATGLTNGSTGYYTVDRFQFVESGSPTFAWTMSQDTDVPTGQGFANSLKMDCTTAQASLGTGDTLYLFHKIEGQNLQQLSYGTANAKTMTLSFWVKSNKTGTYIAELYQTDATRAVSYAYTVSSANTWEKKTITYVGDTSGQIDNDNGTGLQIAFWLATGTDRSSGTLATSWASVNNPDRGVGQVNLADSTSNYINITGVQLETGTVATPFENLQYGQQLAMCQRYYEKSWNQSVSVPSTDTGGAVAMVCMANSSTTLQNNGVRHNFQYRKRTAPTVTVYPIASTTAGSISYARNGQPRATGTASLTNSSEMSIRVGGSASGLTAGYAVELLFHYTANAEL